MMKTDFILVGGGGHALSLLESLPETLSVIGYAALSPSQNIKLEWLGNDATDTTILSLPHPFHIAFIYAGSPLMDKRRGIISRYEKAGARFVTIIAPSAIVTPNSVIGEGSAILAGAIVNRASLGRHVVVNTGAIVEHDCEIGDNTFIGPGAVLGGGVRIGNDCFIGLGARIRNGITIGPGVTVGMGAIVTRNLSKPGIYHGFPLRHHPI
ncbi:MAG: NeuD/PglB/VioB family sugar acetyltransferase [Muribaculaceae bacterium]|nr:NeuD/PglB/VioB family sugar acetyltransferase [Muribaculaceae bacterium]